MKKVIFLLCLSSIFISQAQTPKEESKGFFSNLGDNITNTWKSDKYDLLLPVISWHNRDMYDTHESRKFQEYSWGLGVGKRYYKDKHNLHSLFITANEDSNHSLQVIAGYQYQYKWYLTEELSVGAAIAAGVISREWSEFIPIPIAYPSVSVQYDRFELQATYIPGEYNKGNVLIVMMRIEI